MEQVAKYREVINWIKDEIASGGLQEGDRLMSEQELSEKFSLSRQTIRHATGELEAEGLLRRVRGSGTYVGPASITPVREVFHNIAVISTYVDSYIFPATIRGIESVLSGAGYTMQMAFTDDSVAQEQVILKGLLDKDNIDGLIVEPAKSALPNPNLDMYRELKKRGIPILFFNAYYRDLDMPCVRLDDFEAGRQMTEVLIAAGHRRIGAIFHTEDGQGALRYGGFVQAMLSSQFTVDPGRICWVDAFSFKNIRPMKRFLLERLKGCTGLFCYNDEIARQMIELYREEGIRVPDDVSVVAVDDASVANMGGTPLATCSHPKEQLGIKAAENLLKMIANPAFDGNHLFPCEPMIRDSVRNLRR